MIQKTYNYHSILPGHFHYVKVVFLLTHRYERQGFMLAHYTLSEAGR